MTLDKLQTGQLAIKHRIHDKGAVRRRLMNRNQVSGINIEKDKAMPIGDLIVSPVSRFHLSLHKSEAQIVEIE